MSFDANKALTKAAEHDRAIADAKIPRSFYHASFRGLKTSFEELLGDGERPDRRIVVFVEDLDRCLPNAALEVLESMKLFFDLPGFIFVVGLDSAVVEACVDAKYDKELGNATPDQRVRMRIKGSDYVKKIFQVPFSIAPVSASQLDELLISIGNNHSLAAEQREDIQQHVRPHLNYLVSDRWVNPRDVKRYINAYVVQLKVKPHLQRDVVLAMQTIRFREDWTEITTSLLAFGDVFIRALRSFVEQNDTSPLEGLGIDATTLGRSFFNYLRPNGPGNRLLHVPSIAEYLASGEATQSRSGEDFLKIFQAIGQIRLAIKRKDSVALREMKPHALRIESFLSARGALKGQTGDVDSLTPARQLRDYLEATADPAADELVPLVDRVFGDLRELYRLAV